MLSLIEMPRFDAIAAENRRPDDAGLPDAPFLPQSVSYIPLFLYGSGNGIFRSIPKVWRSFDQNHRME
ncbi:MAG: hypothetical protein CVT72_14885 [Alphaproteobacteria bacterium HGW-Alphaproteobacteria-11]|nr:MAG: hypothetical protein CVT72_14885 [Alphaproteobacteria bacterium HGW-Alphaproteobacteria-11]